MAPGTSQRPNSGMPTTSRPQYTNRAMANGSSNEDGEGSPPAESHLRNHNSFTPAVPFRSIWSVTPRVGRTNHEKVGQRVSSAESGFSMPSGSSALTATSEAEPWARQASSWNNADSTQTRNTPGNTSPNSTRDSVSRQPPNASSYYAQSQPHTQPSMGQRGARSSTSHWSTGTSLDTPSSAHNVSQPGQYTINEGPQSGAAFGQGTRFESAGLARAFPHEHRASHDSYLNFGDTAYSNDNARALGNHSNGEPQSQRTVFGDLAFDSSGAPSGHSQRGSISGLSGSFGGGGMNIRTVANPVSELEERLSRSLSFNESSFAPSSDSGTLTAFNDSGVPPFQFNPGSQSWEAGRPQANGNHDIVAYAVNAAGAFRTNREGLPDRGSPASSAYRQSIGSPRSHAGTPQPASDAWPRPASRDPRARGETSHRGLGQQVLPQHMPAVYPQHYYDQNFSAPLPLYGNHYNPNSGPRYPHGVPYTPQHLPVFMTGTAGLPMRPSRDADLADAQRSQLLKDFRLASKTNRRYELRDIYSHIVEFSGDQYGSRFIQEKLQTANSDEKDQVFREIVPNAVQLMKDVFGNYVVQKLFDHCNQIQKTLLAQAMKGWVASLSVHPYACRVLQKALEHILVEQQQEIVKELEVDAIKVIKDQHGNHVIQKALECVPRQYIGFIFDSLRGKVKELACHNYACRVLQRAIDHGNADDKASIIEEVHKSCPELIDDQYGNYVVQHVLEKGGLEDRTRIINTILGDVVHLSRQKYASNVVEKCAECGTREQVLQIEEEMIMPGPDGISPLRTMITDQFANFVIQKHAKWTPDKQAYFRALRPHLEWAQSSYNGKHVQAIAEMLKGIDSPSPVIRATPSSGGPVSTAPASPLQLDVGSAAPTPNLTMEPNSPSSSPPSTSESAVDEAVEITGKDRMNSEEGVMSGPEIRVQE